MPAVPTRHGKTGVAQRFWYVPVLAAYAAVVAYAVFHHEPWFDEAQAWLVARDCDLGALCTSELRYEGHPVLWYLILKMAIACHLPYEAIGYLSGAIAVVGMGILLAKSPFPKPLAALLPFTFFLCYQYAVIARSYVLLPALLFAIAILSHGRWEKPIRWVVPLMLLANVSSHAFLIAGGIMLVHTVELAFRWRRLDSASRKRQIAALSLYAVAALVGGFHAVARARLRDDNRAERGLGFRRPVGRNPRRGRQLRCSSARC